jgi:lauroyl/myristoyl acyltransferase
MFEYLFYQLVTFISTTFPLRFSYWVALRVSDAYWLLDRKACERVKRNLRRVIGPGAPEAKISYEARWTFRHFGKNIAEFCRFSKFDKRFVEKYVYLDGAGHIDEALARGKGAILLTGHFCNWELGGCVLGLMNYPVTVVARTHANRRVNDFFLGQRQAKGLTVVPLGGAVRACYDALARNGIVGLLGDRDFTDKGVRVKFFGTEVSFPRGAAHLAYRTGAPILPLFVLRRSNDAFILRIHEPIFLDPAKPRDEEVRAATQRYAAILEDYIRWNPSLWWVFEDFFPQLPAGKNVVE